VREERKRTWGLKLLAIALAVTAWVALTVKKPENVSEKTVEASIRYDNFPNLILKDKLEKVTVGIRGPESKIGQANSTNVSVTVELKNPAKGIFEVPLTQDNVILPDEDLEVISFDPNIIPLELDREARQLIRVRAQLEGEPAAGAVVEHAEVIPPSVLVRGPESELQKVTALTTTPVSLTGHALDFREQAAVLPPHPLISVVQPAVVTVQVHMMIPGTESETADGESSD